MRQLKVNMPPDLRAQLEAASATAGHSVSEEIRRRLEATLSEGAIEPKTFKLLVEIAELARLLKRDTGHDWHAHAAAYRAFQIGIGAVMAQGRPAGEPVFAAGELPAERLVASDNPETIGVALAAIARLHRPLSEAEMRELKKRTGDVPPSAIPPGFKGSLSDLMQLMAEQKKKEGKS